MMADEQLDEMLFKNEKPTTRIASRLRRTIASCVKHFLPSANDTMSLEEAELSGDGGWAADRVRGILTPRRYPYKLTTLKELVHRVKCGTFYTTTLHTLKERVGEGGTWGYPLHG